MSNILPRHYILGIVFFCFVLLGGMSIISNIATTDPSFIDNEQFDSFNETFNVYEDINDQITGMRSNIEEAETDMGIFGILNSLISTAWQSLKLLFSSLGFMNGVFNGLESFLGLPGYIGALLILVVTVIIAFAIYSAVFQREI